MITATQLESAGYQKYPALFKQYATCLWQKCFDDSEGKKYFIQLYEYDNREWNKKHPNMAFKDFAYSSEVKFKDGYGNTFNVECLTNDSIEQVEEFFERVWVNCGCEYYELFGE